jgi:DedD protein
MKQRLVGTIVLGALALILIPLLLDGEGVEPPPMSATIPPAPVIDTAPLPQPERPEILADASLPEVAPTADALAAAPESPPAPTVEPTSTAAETTDTITATTPEESNATAAVPAADSGEPQLNARGLPEAWTVRLGSFGDRANADALVKRLVAAGHKAYIRPVPSGQGTLNGVFVGPVLTRNEAASLQRELAAAFQLEGIVLQFDATR